MASRTDGHTLAGQVQDGTNRSNRNHTKRKHREVQSDHVYKKNLTTIIQRDYFPDVPNLESQLTSSGTKSFSLPQHYDSDDVQYHPFASNDNTTFDDNNNTNNEMSLTKFHNITTSESNVEFEKTQKKLSDSYQRKLLSRTIIPVSKAQGQDPDSANRLITNFELENSLFFIPKGLITHEPNDRKDDHKGDGYYERTESTTDTNTIDNILMPPPSITIDTTTDSIVESRNINIVPSATRFPTMNNDNEVIGKRNQQSIVPFPNNNHPNDTKQNKEEHHLEGDDATSIATSSHHNFDSISTMTGYSTDLDSIPPPLYIERIQGQIRKQRELNSFVPMNTNDAKICTKNRLPENDTDYQGMPQGSEVAGTIINRSDDMPFYQMPNEKVNEIMIRNQQIGTKKNKLDNYNQEILQRKKIGRAAMSLSYTDKTRLAKLTPAARSLWMQTTKQKNRSILKSTK